MRPTFRSVLIALVAVFAFGALASASASAALPEFGLGTKYPVPFTGSGSTASFKGAGGTYVCSGSSITGEIVGPKEVAKVVVKFTDASNCVEFCQQTGFEKWETKELKGTIGYLVKSSHTVGLLLEPVAEPIAKCTHNVRSGAKLQGSIIGELGPVNLSRSSLELNFRGAPGGGEQTLRSFEGEELTHRLQMLQVGGGPEPFGLSAQMTLTFARAVKIEA
jgi:hypothetical protein